VERHPGPTLCPDYQLPAILYQREACFWDSGSVKVILTH
jgi:hypothetical protein